MKVEGHGGLNPGAPRGARNGNFTDGTWSAEAVEERRWLQRRFDFVRCVGSEFLRDLTATFDQLAAS